jgi:hypothetical protein
MIASKAAKKGHFVKLLPLLCRFCHLGKETQK